MLGNLRAFGNIIRATKPVVFVFINSGLSLQIELDVTVCKTYNYMMKAMKAEPYFVATYEGKFSSKCDDILLSQQNAAASSTKATSKARKTTSTTTTTEATEEEEEPIASSETSSSTMDEVEPSEEPVSEEVASKETTLSTSASMPGTNIIKRILH